MRAVPLGGDPSRVPQRGGVPAWYAAFPLTGALTGAQAADFGEAAGFPRVLAVGAGCTTARSR